MVKTFIGGLCEGGRLPTHMEIDYTSIDALWNKNLSSLMDEGHRALATMVSLLTPDDEIETNCKMIVLNPNETEYVRWLYSPVPLTAGGNKQNYDTLIHKRHFKIDPDVGAFKLERFGFLNYRDTIVNSWAAYAVNCPFWQNVFSSYKIQVGREGQLILEDDVDDGRLEAFGDEYGFVFELDDPRQVWAMEQGWGEVDSEKDIVDLMDELFTNAEDLRMEFGDLAIDITRNVYESNKDVFSFDKLNKILDTI
jgi:hypothetical protein